jgi:spore maturation protein A
MLVVLNSASIQLIPATVAAVRASNGASAPFDILPAVWITSVITVSSAIMIAKLLSRFSKRDDCGGGLRTPESEG